MYCSKCRVARDAEQIGREPTDGGVNYFCITCSTTLETRLMCGPCGGVEKAPMSTLNDAGQLVYACPTCSNPMGLALTAPTCASGKSIGDKVDAPIRPVRDAQPRNDAPVRPQQVTRGPSALATPTIAAGDIEGTIRTRLFQIDAEIALRKGLEVEAKTLRKMLAAAERARAQMAARDHIAGLIAAPTATTTN